MTPAWNVESFRADPSAFLAQVGQGVGLDAYFQEDPPDPLLEEEARLAAADRLTRLGYPDDGASLEDRIVDFRTEAGLTPGQGYDAKAARLLTALADWDGAKSIPWRRDLQGGSCGPFVRSLQYRLQTLGFLNETPDGVFADHTRMAVKSFRATFGVEDPQPDRVAADLFSILADPYRLNDLLLDAIGHQPVVVECPHCLSLLNDEVPPGTYFYLRDGLFERSDLPPGQTPGFASIPVAADHLVQNRLSQTAGRLIQLWFCLIGCFAEDAEDAKPWKQIDGIFGKRSMEAFRVFLSDFNVAEDEHRFLAAHGDTCLLIAPAAFSLLGGGEQDLEKHEAFLAQEMERVLRRENTGKDTLAESNEGFFHRLWERAKSGVRRVWGTVKSAVLQVGRAIARGALSLWEKIGELGRSALHFMSAALSRLKQVMSTLWGHVRRLSSFVQSRAVVTLPKAPGQNPILGKGPVMVTLFDADFDVINFFPFPVEGHAVPMLENHRIETILTGKAVVLACNVVSTVVSTVVKILEGPFGWLQIAFGLLRALLDLFTSEEDYAFV